MVRRWPTYSFSLLDLPVHAPRDAPQKHRPTAKRVTLLHKLHGAYGALTIDEPDEPEKYSLGKHMTDDMVSVGERNEPGVHERTLGHMSLGGLIQSCVPQTEPEIGGRVDPRSAGTARAVGESSHESATRPLRNDGHDREPGLPGLA